MPPKTSTELTKIASDLKKSRLDFTNKVGKALMDTRVFSADINLAIGEISIEEAEEAIIAYFAEQIRKGSTVTT